MQITRKTAREIALSLAGIVLTIIVLDPLGQFAVAYLQERGFYDHPSRTVDTVISALSAITHSGIFHWLGGISVGLACGLWLDAILRARAARQVAVSVPNPEKGLLDYQKDLRGAQQRFHLIMIAIGREQERLTKEVVRHTDKINRYRRKRSESDPRYLDGAIGLSASLAAELDEYAEHMGKLNDALAEAAGGISKSTQWLFANRADWRANKDAVGAVKFFQGACSDNVTKINEFSLVLQSTRGLSAVLNAALDRTAAVLDTSRDIMLALVTFCTTVIRTAEG